MRNPIDICAHVADTFQIPITSIVSGEGQTGTLVAARYIAMYMIRKHNPHYGLADTAESVGKKHPTALYACERVRLNLHRPCSEVWPKCNVDKTIQEIIDGN